jgi:glucose-6-phosphate 1-dehydrogenase
VFNKPDGPYRHSTPVVGNSLSIALHDDGTPTFTFAVDGEIVSSGLGELEPNPMAAYVRLIADVIANDRSLFTTPEGLDAAWNTIAPILDDRPAIQPYERGSWGPTGARDLAGPTGWILGS